MDKQTENSILASFTADAYLLGSHWVYDETQLKNLPINWEQLNAPQAMWHRDKKRGDFTHYGDQTFFLLEYMTKNKTFVQEDYYTFWHDKMSSYKGYIDAATRGALKIIGSPSSELSICGRFAPLLIRAKSKEDFLSSVNSLVEITHNSGLAKTASKFFAQLLWESRENQNITGTLQKLKSSYPTLLTWIDEGVRSADKDTFSVIRDFGPACGIDGGFAGVIHLLSLEDDFTTLMQKNAKAGGDSSARGMVVAMILGTQDDFKPNETWTNNINLIKKIRENINANI
ncbi:MAG: ADP-ribosylglycohydrolase family protein [Sulfurimonas sp.]